LISTQFIIHNNKETQPKQTTQKQLRMSVNQQFAKRKMDLLIAKGNGQLTPSNFQKEIERLDLEQHEWKRRAQGAVALILRAWRRFQFNVLGSDWRTDAEIRAEPTLLWPVDLRDRLPPRRSLVPLDVEERESDSEEISDDAISLASGDTIPFSACCEESEESDTGNLEDFDEDLPDPIPEKKERELKPMASRQQASGDWDLCSGACCCRAWTGVDKISGVHKSKLRDGEKNISMGGRCQKAGKVKLVDVLSEWEARDWGQEEFSETGVSTLYEANTDWLGRMVAMEELVKKGISRTLQQLADLSDLHGPEPDEIMVCKTHASSMGRMLGTLKIPPIGSEPDGSLFIPLHESGFIWEDPMSLLFYGGNKTTNKAWVTERGNVDLGLAAHPEIDDLLFSKQKWRFGKYYRLPYSPTHKHSQETGAGDYLMGVAYDNHDAEV
jgi:hypothetical protein